MWDTISKSWLAYVCLIFYESINIIQYYSSSQRSTHQPWTGGLAGISDISTRAGGDLLRAVCSSRLYCTRWVLLVDSCGYRLNTLTSANWIAGTLPRQCNTVSLPPFRKPLESHLEHVSAKGRRRQDYKGRATRHRSLLKNDTGQP